MARATTPSTLQDLSYETSIDNGFGDAVSPRHGGPSAKYTYMERCKRFLKAISLQLPTLTFKVSSNPAGPGSPGDVSMLAWRGAQVIHCALVYRPDVGHAHFYWRIGPPPFAVDGTNQWIEDPETTPDIIAEQIRLMSYAPQAERSP